MTKKQELMRSLIGNGCRLLLICMFMTLIDLPSTLSYLFGFQLKFTGLNSLLQTEDTKL